MTWLEYVFLVPAILLFGYAAVSDFKSWRIPNWTILALIAVYAVGTAVKTVVAPTNVLSLLEAHHAAEGFFDVHAIWSDLGAAGLLFVLGVIFWLVRMFGAGDAKLFFPIGLYIGWIGLLPFSVLLVVAGGLCAIRSSCRCRCPCSSPSSSCASTRSARPRRSPTASSWSSPPSEPSPCASGAASDAT